jgi:dipeptidyl aminopeptidase/acylaminoacyl peptidase
MVLNDNDTDFSAILKENTLTDFVPSDSLILFHSEADSWVYVSNTKNAYNKMRGKGAPVRCEIIPAEENQDHEEAAITFFWSTILNIFTTGEMSR